MSSPLRWRRAPRALSLRSRLAALFAAGTTVIVLLAAGVLWLGLNRQLDDAIDEGLRERGGDMAALVRDGAGVPDEEAFAQVVAPGGDVIDSSATSVRILTPAEVRAATRGEILLDREVPGLGERARLLVRRAQPGTDVVVVVGSSLDPVLHARTRLAVALVLGAPLLAAAVAGAGWWLAGAALQPVVRMTEEADAISTANTGRRLPQPAADDEIGRLGLTLNAMLDRIAAAAAHERAFLDDASHELRTPIAILRAELELALAGPVSDGDVHATLVSVLEEVERLGRLTDDLLVLARAQAGGIPLAREPVDVRALAADVCDRLRLAGGAVIDMSTTSVVADVDPQRFEQILVNVVRNAQRHAHQRIAVVVEAPSEQSGAVTVMVADDGEGFPDELLPVVLDRFTRADTARGRANGGAGLGLAITADLVEAHGGAIHVGNGAPLGGAVVRITISGECSRP